MTTEISVMYGSEKVNQYELYERSMSVILLLLKQTAYILCNMYTCLPTIFPEIRLVQSPRAVFFVADKLFKIIPVRRRAENFKFYYV